jgi:epoxyqueuosine reductase
VASLEQRIRDAALGLGFSRVGFGSAEPLAEGRERLERWRAAEYHAGLGYMADGERADPRALLPEARGVVVVAMAYARPTPIRASRDGAPLHGAVAAYARGADYHAVMKAKLRALADAVAGLLGRAVLSRACVDTAPLLERELAARAGIAFIGKSTLAIVPGLGTNVLLGELLLDVELEASAPVAQPGCGSCSACLEACPTGAFVAAHVLDARRCISYWTIEHHGPIPRELRALIGAHVFGCDVCQVVCPFDASPHEVPPAPELAGRIPEHGLELVTLLSHGNAGHRKLVRRSALRRTSRAVLARNAAIALGNLGDTAAVPPLVRALGEDRSPLVRSHVAWALGRLGGAQARAALERAAQADLDQEVREEARAALRDLDGSGTGAYRSG